MKISSYIYCAAVAVLFQVGPALGVGDCGCSSCTSSVLDEDADGYTVRDRIDWVITNMTQSETYACGTVCGDEFQGVCGSECNPSQCGGGGGGGGGGGSRCGCSACTTSVLARDADGSLVGGRIDWVMANMGKSEEDACDLVCGVEYPDVCGECDCDGSGGGGGGDPKCATCSWDNGNTCPDLWCNESQLNCNVCTGTWFGGPSWAPSKGPTKVETGGPPDLTGSPTAFMATLASIVAVENTTEPTSAPMVEALPTMTTESPVTVLTRGDSDNIEEVEGVGMDNSFLEGEGDETFDTNLQGEQETDNPLPIICGGTDDGSSNGEDEGSRGFPALGYAAIGLGAALAVL